MKKIRTTLCFMLFLILTRPLSAQDIPAPFAPLSARGRLIQNVGNTLIELEFERPSVRGREIFGGLVPWDKVWRTGAGPCTKISFSDAISFGGHEVPAGSYSLFTIPNPKEWTVILNSDTSLYGSYDYDPDKDVARLQVLPVYTQRHYEALTFELDILPNDARLYISWANTQVSFEIGTYTDERIEAFIEGQLLTHKESNADLYPWGAEYLYLKRKDLIDALDLAETGIEKDDSNEWARSLKILIYEALGQYAEALTAIEEYREFVNRYYASNKEDQTSTYRFLDAEESRIRALMD
jgi:tetratricopeptide (TPR) repeat protein